MRIRLDEDVPYQVLAVLRHILQPHVVDHVAETRKSKVDRSIYLDAKAAGYELIITNDHAQLDDPAITDAIRKSRLHRVEYTQRVKGKRGLALASASIIAAMPDIVAAAEAVQAQRLFTVRAINPADRFEVVDPQRNPPRYWGR